MFLLIVFIFVLILIFLFYKFTHVSHENFMMDCSCTGLPYDDCLVCKNCGLCTDEDGNTNCSSTKSSGKCVNWQKYNDNYYDIYPTELFPSYPYQYDDIYNSYFPVDKYGAYYGRSHKTPRNKSPYYNDYIKNVLVTPSPPAPHPSPS